VALPPGPRRPRWLQTLEWLPQAGPMLERAQKRYGDAFTLKIAYEGTWVMFSHPDAVKQIFTGDPRVFHAGEGNHILRPFLGASSVLVLDEAEHMHTRKLLLPPFHGERMLRYARVIGDIARAEIERWPRGEPMELGPRMQALTLEVIMRAIFGVEDAERLTQLRTALRRLLEEGVKPRRLALVLVIGPEGLERSRFYRSLMDPVEAILYEEIARRRTEPDLDRRDDILSLLVQARDEDGRPMTDKELRDQLMTLLVAGHETTASALAWAIERLVRHPEMLGRLREEARAGEDVYADAVCKETLRIRPVVYLVARRLTEPVEIGGFELPAGVTAVPCVYLVHRRPDVYPEPERFRPERFLEQPAGTYTWIPFGGGVRRCIGGSFAVFEMKTVLTAVADQVELRPARSEAERPRRRLITFTPGRRAEVVLA
jgi:cytochrome P450 family 135